MNILLETPIKVLNSKRGYTEAIKEFPLIRPSAIKAGRFYAMEYDFSLDYPEDVVKYFDKFPLDLCLSTKGPQHFYGLNFHFLPVLSRSWLMGRLKGLAPNTFKEPGNKVVKITYQTIKSVMSKSQYCIRMYRRDRVRQVREIPNHRFAELVKYAPPTFYKVKMKDVVERHRSYPVIKESFELASNNGLDVLDTPNYLDKMLEIPISDILDILQEINN